MTVPTTATLLPPTPDLSEAKRRLYETALVLFGERGYAAVSVRDVANVLGQQPGALYAHVSSKEQMLFELSLMGLREHRKRMQAALLDAGRDPVDQVRAFVYAHVQTHLEYPALARVVTNEHRSLSVEHQEESNRRRRDLEQMFLEVIARGVKLGVFNPSDPMLVVHAIGAMGVRAPEWWNPETSPSIDHIATHYAEFALKLLA